MTYDYDKWLEKVPEIDFIVIGEGERTFKQLLDYHSGKIDINDVQGIAYLKEKQLKATAPGPKLDLREVPSPFRFPEDVPQLS